MSTAKLDLRTIQYDGECSINEAPPECQDAEQVVKFLAEKEFGFGITLKVPFELRKRTVQAIRAAAPRQGFTVGTKSTQDGFRVFKQEPKELDSKIAEMARLRSEEGMTLAAVGKRFGVTRERVRQLTPGVRKFSSNKQIGEIRTKEFLEFCEPYIQAVSDLPRCIVCLEPTSRRSAGVCKNCHALVKVLTRVSSRIRSYKNCGNKLHLSDALQHIRKYNLKPEDLVLM